MLLAGVALGFDAAERAVPFGLLNQVELVEIGVVTAAGCWRMPGARGMASGAGIHPQSSSGVSGYGWRRPGGSPLGTASV
jgi:hypothetical protein